MNVKQYTSSFSALVLIFVANTYPERKYLKAKENKSTFTKVTKIEVPLILTQHLINDEKNGNLNDITD